MIKDFFHLGKDADDEEQTVAGKAPIQTEAAEPFDPIAALREGGFIAESSLPQEIELEPVSTASEDEDILRGIAPDENGQGDARPGDMVPVGAPLNLDAFRTADHGDLSAEEAPVLADGPTLAPASDYSGTPDERNPKDLLGIKKPDLSLVPSAGVLLEAQAMMDGARKYGPYNWREKKVLMMIYLAAAKRHIDSIIDGEDIDPVSGAYHLGHARACLGITADAQFTGNLIDDRPKAGAAGKMIRRFEETGSFRPD